MPSATPEPAAGFDLAAVVAGLLGRRLGDERFAVAVSGGGDSLALLVRAGETFGPRVVALTVDHGLRAAAADEARGVAGHAARLGVGHATLRWDGPYPAANLQAAARAARYRLMGDWCAANGVGVLATAHHADDQAETLLMRLARGSGSGGLAGIRAVRPLSPGVTLIRPVLTLSRAQLGAALAGTGIVPADDPSNRATRFDRTHARALLAATPWLAAERLAAAAGHIAEAEAALEWTAARAWDGRAVVGPPGVAVDAADLPRELVRRLVVRALTAVAPGAAPDGPGVERLVAALEGGRGATLAGVAARIRDSGGGRLWHFSPEPKRR